MRTKKSIKVWVLCLLIAAFCMMLTGCIPGDGTNSATHAAGFFSGIWHGWIAPVSLVMSFFKKHLGIYEVYNNGFLYDLGYYMAIISGFGGLTFVRRKKSQGDGTHDLS